MPYSAFPPKEQKEGIEFLIPPYSFFSFLRQSYKAEKEGIRKEKKRKGAKGNSYFPW